MKEETSEKKSINWIAIIIALAAITTGRYFWATARGDSSQDNRGRPEGFVTPQLLGVDLSSKAIEVDVLNDGRIVVEGRTMTLEEFEGQVSLWKKSRKIISYYREPLSEVIAQDGATAAKVILDARMAFSPRFKPQTVEQAAPTGGGKPPN
jgi:hypothetical protein